MKNLDKTIEVKGERELVILFEAGDKDDFSYIDIEGLNFIYLSAQIFINGELSSDCSLTAKGDIDSWESTNEFEGKYTVETSGFDRVVYHNNQDGKEYTQNEFIRKFCNPKYRMIGEHATRDNIYTESVWVL